MQYQWTLKTIKKQDNPTAGLNSIIVQTHWELKGTDEDGDEGTFSGATPFDPSEVDPTNFTEYENLTEQQVLGWIKDVVNNNLAYKQHIEERIQQQINTAKNPIVEVSSNTFPWSQETANTNN